MRLCPAEEQDCRLYEDVDRKGNEGAPMRRSARSSGAEIPLLGTRWTAGAGVEVANNRRRYTEATAMKLAGWRDRQTALLG